MRRFRAPLCLALAATTVAATGGVASADDPLPTEQKYIYVDIDYKAVLVGPNTIQLVYRCSVSGSVLVVSVGVTCGSATTETRFLPGAYSALVRTEEVPASAVSVSVTGTGVFSDGTIVTVSCSTTNVLEPSKYTACDRFG